MSLGARVRQILGVTIALGAVGAVVLALVAAPAAQVERWRALADRWGQEYDVDVELVLAVTRPASSTARPASGSERATCAGSPTATATSVRLR
jgi:hypothetical protein